MCKKNTNNRILTVALTLSKVVASSWDIGKEELELELQLPVFVAFVPLLFKSSRKTTAAATKKASASARTEELLSCSESGVLLIYFC